MKVTIKGQLHEVQEPQTFPSGFTKQVAVVVIPGDYPDYFPIEMLKDRVGSFDSVQVGSEVVVDCYLGGREYEGRYYLGLKFAGLQGQTPAAAPAASVQPAPAPAADGDNLPF